MIAITTTLQDTTYDFLQKEATSRKVAKNKILEEALSMYKKSRTSNRIKESYKNLKNDMENIELAEMGLEDFNLGYE